MKNERVTKGLKGLKHTDSLNTHKLSATFSKTPLCSHLFLRKLIYTYAFNMPSLYTGLSSQTQWAQSCCFFSLSVYSFTHSCWLKSCVLESFCVLSLLIHFYLRHPFRVSFGLYMTPQILEEFEKNKNKNSLWIRYFHLSHCSSYV